MGTMYAIKVCCLVMPIGNGRENVYNFEAMHRARIEGFVTIRKCGMGYLAGGGMDKVALEYCRSKLLEGDLEFRVLIRLWGR